MDSRQVVAVGAALLALLCTGALADTPGEPYTLRLGPGNEDLERQLNALPWLRRPEWHFEYKDASAIDFSGRDLRMAEIHFELKGLYGARFDNCNLDGSSLDETRFRKCSFRDASLRFCQMDHLASGPEESNDFTNADITGSWFWSLSGKSLAQTRNYQERRLVGIDLLGGSLHETSFRDCVLLNVRLPRVAGSLRGSDFTNAALHRTAIPPSVSHAQLCSTANYKNKDFSDSLFYGAPGDLANYREFDFAQCSFGYFLNCDLSNARLEDACFLVTKATQVDAPPSGTPLTMWLYHSMAKLSDAGLDGCIVSESQLRRTLNWKRKDLKKLHLKNLALDDWDLSGMAMLGADLRGSSMKGVNLRDADLRDVRLEGCLGLAVEQLLQSKTYRSWSRQDVLRNFPNVDFADLTDEERAFHESLRLAVPPKEGE